MKKNYINIFFFLLCLGFTLTTCKKYPENTLWFKNVSKIKFFDHVKLTAFTVNGIDSLQQLNNYFGAKVSDKNISNTYFDAVELSNTDGEIAGLFRMSYPVNADNIYVEYGYSKNKKEIGISFGRFGIFDTSAFKRNLFIDNTTYWQIIKLLPNGTRKIKKTVNDNTYELQFDKF